MAILRDPGAALIRLLARFGRERGQSFTEYALILAVLSIAAVAVLGIVGAPISRRFDMVASALGGEGDKPAFAIVNTLPLWIAVGVLAVGAVAVFLLTVRRD